MPKLKEQAEAPIFESVKSCYLVRCRNDFERILVELMEASPKVRAYYQPMTHLKIKSGDREYSVSLDFHVQYVNDSVEMVHIESTNAFSPEVKAQVFYCVKNLLQLRGFGFVVVSKEQVQQLIGTNLTHMSQLPVENFCSANFEWIN